MTSETSAALATLRTLLSVTVAGGALSFIAALEFLASTRESVFTLLRGRPITPIFSFLASWHLLLSGVTAVAAIVLLGLVFRKPTARSVSTAGICFAVVTFALTPVVHYISFAPMRELIRMLSA